LLAGQTLTPPPAEHHLWLQPLEGRWPRGEMLNGQLGDCTCAAYYHALQVWSTAFIVAHARAQRIA
jgi:hypothetical protein